MRIIPGLAEIRADAMNEFSLRMSLANLPGSAVVHLQTVQPSDHRGRLIQSFPASLHDTMRRCWSPIGDLPVLEEFKEPANLMAVLHQFFFDAPEPCLFSLSKEWASKVYHTASVQESDLKCSFSSIAP